MRPLLQQKEAKSAYGDGNVDDSLGVKRGRPVSEPTPVPGLSGIVSISCGNTSNVALSFLVTLFRAGLLSLLLSRAVQCGPPGMSTGAAISVCITYRLTCYTYLLLCDQSRFQQTLHHLVIARSCRHFSLFASSPSDYEMMECLLGALSIT